MTRYAALLRRRDYRLLWLGATVSALGDGMSFVALVWLVISITGDPATVGLMAAVYTAPVVIGGLAAGLVLDRFDRRRAVALDNVVRGLAIASIPVAAALGVLTLGQVFLVAAIYGLLFMTSLAGIPSLIPALVDETELTTANAMETLSYAIAGLAGPALAGVVIAFFSAPAVLALDALSYGFFVVCLLAMRPISGERQPAPSDTAEAASGGGLAPAVRFVLGTPAVLAITLMYMALNVGEGIFLVLAPVYARDTLHGDASTYGLLVSAFTAGTLLGSLIVGALDWPWPLGRSIAAASLASGLTIAVLVITPALLPTVLVLALAGLFASSLTAWAQTIRMRLIPPEMRGRVFALLRTLMQSTPPLGAVLSGWLLARGDLVPAVALAAAFMIVPGTIGLFVPALGRASTGET